MDRVAQYAVPVRLLIPEDIDQRQQWNCSAPPWSAAEVFAALHFMEEEGWIRFYTHSEGGPIDGVVTPKPVLLLRELIDNYDRGRTLTYRLTDYGGDTWENAARPNWSLTYDSNVEVASDQEAGKCIVTATSEDLVRRAFLVTVCSQNLLAIPGTEQYTSISAWNPTYWKTLDKGVRLVASIGNYTSGVQLEFMLPSPTQRYYAESCRMFEQWYRQSDDRDWHRP